MKTTPLPSIYVPKSVSDDRKTWFNKKKYLLLNEVAQGDGALSEIQEVNISKAVDMSVLIDEFSTAQNMDGMRIYFCTRGIKKDEEEVEDQDDCGRFNFIFVCTVDGADNGNYYSYKLKSKKLVVIPLIKAKKWVRNYQKVNGKRDRLNGTLTASDVSDKCFETKHIWFDLKKINELKIEISEQLKKDKKAGLKIKLVSYTDEKFIDGIFGYKVLQSHQQRLTINFVFIDKNGHEVYLDEDALIIRTIAAIYNIGQPFIGDEPVWDELFSPPYDRAKLNKILEELSRDKYIDWRKALNEFYTMDTGDPTPPPSTDNKKGLDISDQ